jgi:hypothetical protein
MSVNATKRGPRRPRSRSIPPERGDEVALFLEHQRFLLRVTARRFGGSQELAEGRLCLRLAPAAALPAGP